AAMVAAHGSPPAPIPTLRTGAIRPTAALACSRLPRPALPCSTRTCGSRSPANETASARGLGPSGSTVDPEWGLIDPAAGTWFPEQAVQLAQLATPSLKPWPPGAAPRAPGP